MLKLNIKIKVLPDGSPITLTGRSAWALLELVKAGQRGCTPIENPGPRWSAYIFILRTDYALAIETINESHGGQFAGTHARYVLHSAIEILSSNAPVPQSPSTVQVAA